MSYPGLKFKDHMERSNRATDSLTECLGFFHTVEHATKQCVELLSAFFFFLRNKTKIDLINISHRVHSVMNRCNFTTS